MWFITTILVAWLSVTSGCGGLLALSIFSPDAKFKTPNYPEAHEAIENCAWIVSIPAHATDLHLICDIHTFRDSQGICTDVIFNFTNGIEEKIVCGNTKLIKTLTGYSNEFKFRSKMAKNTQYKGVSCKVSFDPYEMLNAEKEKLPYICGLKGEDPNPETNEVAPHEYPWLVLLKKINSNVITCTGSLIARQWVLLAAHCVGDFAATDLSVLLGLENQKYSQSANEEVQVSQIIKHTDSNNDIALIQLAIYVALNDMISPICLPFHYIDKDFNSNDGIVTGLGESILGDAEGMKDIVKEFNQTIWMYDDCKKLVKKKVSSNTICGVGEKEGVCFGNDGGQIVWKSKSSNLYFQLGIMLQGTCNKQTEPTLYTSVLPFIGWIVEQTKGSEEFCVKS